METANLRAFVQVALTRSFSAAARELHLTQPAVSKRIATLETQLSARLFDRIGRRVRLTEAGATLLPRARRILSELRASTRAIRNLDGRVQGPMLIGTSHHVGLHKLPPVLSAYTRGYPQVELDIRFLDSEVIVQEVERGELELGIATLPETPPEGVVTTPVWRDELVIATSAEHPLAGLKCVDAAMLSRHRAILPGRGTYTRRIIEKAVAPLGATLKISLETNYLETIKMMVSVGLGWSILPRQMLDADFSTMRLRDTDMFRVLGVVRHGGFTLSNAARAMLETISRLEPGVEGLDARDGGDTGVRN